MMKQIDILFLLYLISYSQACRSLRDSFLKGKQKLLTIEECRTQEPQMIELFNGNSSTLINSHGVYYGIIKLNKCVKSLLEPSEIVFFLTISKSNCLRDGKYACKQISKNKCIYTTLSDCKEIGPRKECVVIIRDKKLSYEETDLIKNCVHLLA